MMDWKGNIIEGKTQKHKIMLKYIEDDPAMISSAQISQVETEFIDNIFSPVTKKRLLYMTKYLL